MFELATQRLRVIALDAENLAHSIENPILMERNLGLCQGSARPEGDLREAMQQMLRGVVENERSYLWYTNWKIVRRDGDRVVGGLCFKGPPDGLGQVEVGYGIEAQYQNHGYMTEALRAACQWALAQPGVQAVIAETDMEDSASQRVLQRAGFLQYRHNELACWWRLAPQQSAPPT